MSFLRPNLDRTGRIIRAVLAALLLVAAFLVWPRSGGAGIALMAAALFVGFEAARGWCAVRACGIRTKF